MISWIVASHNDATLAANLGMTLQPGPDDHDEIVLVRGARSIAEAYQQGQQRATQPIRCYVHHDVQILDQARLRAELGAACTPSVGMVGVIGSRLAVVPWWKEDQLGSVIDTRFGRLDFGPGGDCAILDGLLLATVHRLDWDTSIPGWHGYDHDICQQQLALGRRNWCLTGGAGLVLHNTAGPTRMRDLDGWTAAADVVRSKWSEHG